jgi:ribosome-binding factor A
VKHHTRRRGGNTPVGDQEFVRALEERGWGRTSAKRQGERKTRQFCRQVQRALNLALSDCRKDGDAGDLYVEEVTPAPNCAHLIAHVVVPPNRDVRAVLQTLGGDLPRLRCEVAAAISRKRAPEISFVPAFAEGACDA